MQIEIKVKTLCMHISDKKQVYVEWKRGINIINNILLIGDRKAETKSIYLN
jgi:hypothetical protein